MYGHQSIPRSVSAGQLNAMMSHPGMVITSQQMMNTVCFIYCVNRRMSAVITILNILFK